MASKKHSKFWALAFLHTRIARLLREKLSATRIDDVGYYRQLLRLVYRLLFLMVAEERRLLFVPSREEAVKQEIYTRWYSIARLREQLTPNYSATARATFGKASNKPSVFSSRRTPRRNLG